MDSVADHPRRYAVLAILLTATALYFGSGLTTIPALTWLAPLPVFLLAPRVSGRLAALTAFAGWSLGLANLWRYLLKDLELPPPTLSFLLLLAGVFTATVLLFRALAVRRRFVLAALAGPACWAACDFLIATVSPHGTFTSLAYTQAEVRPVVQLASLTGPWGITFLLMLPAAVLAIIFAPGVKRRAVLQISIGFAMVALGTIGYGAWRLNDSTSTKPPIRIAVVSANTDDDSNWTTPGGPSILRNYTRAINEAARQGAQVVLLPEKIIDIQAAALPGLSTSFQKLATSNKITLVVGLTVFGDQGNDYNRALVFSPAGGAPTAYDKHHLIPALEPYASGDHLGLLAGPAGERWGVLICKDLDFPALSRQYGKGDVDLLLVPALDFDNDGWLHSRMALLRGIENGIPMARDGSKGLLTLTDQHGRVVSERPAASNQSATLIGTLTPGIASTPYTRLGDWFAYLCVILTVGCCWSARPRRRRSSGHRPNAL
ncbi:apolipoprotein N-acyltransferase [Kribbella monticola]|uniref:apolipoprotein N-acyltransferase n=1 Tax=Kribbella monticola TaxID=2185285 RepID=UPI000DD475CE|nr:nitrilase-related carbon-nitrogen hydrolase [Kribbella monticola]